MKTNTYCVIVIALLTVSVYGQEKAEKQDKIQVSTASYGLNCGANASGNATDYVRQECDGKRSCSFAVQQAAGKIGDHCPGTTKEFDYVYVCGDREKKGKVQGESSGKTAFLTCAE